MSSPTKVMSQYDAIAATTTSTHATTTVMIRLCPIWPFLDAIYGVHYTLFPNPLISYVVAYTPVLGYEVSVVEDPILQLN
jgi:hypothetical protein